MQVVESKRPVLVLSHRNCEIHCCHLDGYHDNSSALLCRLAQIEDNFISHATRRIWFNADESTMSKEIMEKTANSIVRLRPKIFKIAFVGFGKRQYSFERLLTKLLHGTILCRSYFQDADLAKDWLV